jgi:hypothetical protein
MGATLLFVGMAALMLLVSSKSSQESRIPLVMRARVIKWSGSAVIGLLFFDVARSIFKGANIPGGVAEAVLLGGLLSVFSLLYFLSLARGVHVTLNAAASLLGGGTHSSQKSSVSPALAPLLWMVAALIGLLAAGLRTPKELSTWTVSGWAILGAAFPLLGALQTGELVRKHRAQMLALEAESETGDVRLGDALAIATRSVKSGAWIAPLSATVIPTLLLALHFGWADFPFESAGYGASLGSLLLGGALVSLFDESEPEPFFGHAAFLFALSLAAVTFITLGRLSLSVAP